MADSMILGEDVLIEFYKDGDFYTYRCAIDVSINLSIQSKEVRTVGDGYWARTRGKKASYSISLNGLIDIDQSEPTAWLLEYYARTMMHIDFRLNFNQPEFGLEKVFTGQALITDLTLGGGSTGFATGNMELEGFGAYTLQDALTTCNAFIESADGGDAPIETKPPFTAAISYSGLTNSSRIEYSLDGGGRDVIISDEDSSGAIFIFDVSLGDHQVILYPICPWGDEGTPYIVNFTITR